MQNVRRKTVADNDPEWQNFMIEYMRRRWTDEQEKIFTKLVDRVVEETRMYPPEERPSTRKILMCMFNMVK